MSTELRIRSVSTEVRVEVRGAAASRIVGYAAVYFRAGEPGTEFQMDHDVFERIAPGAFDRAIREVDVRGLFNHESTYLLGRTTSGTLRLSSDSRGLRYEIDPPDTETAREVLALIRRGDVTGSSFAFNILPGGDRVHKEAVNGKTRYIRELTSLKLFDVGPVTFPAYKGATTSVRLTSPGTGREGLDYLTLLSASMQMQSALDGKPAPAPQRSEMVASPVSVESRPGFSTRLGGRW